MFPRLRRARHCLRRIHRAHGCRDRASVPSWPCPDCRTPGCPRRHPACRAALMRAGRNGINATDSVVRSQPSLGREEVMRKTLAICLFLVLCCVSGVGQTQAQWAVVWSVALFNQSSPINRTVAFTPTEDGVYRLSCAMSGRGSNNNYNFQMYWALPDGGIGEYALIP